MALTQCVCVVFYLQRYASASYDGEAMLILPCSKGILCSTLHFDSLRDGLEDYEFYVTLSQLVQAAKVRL